MHDLIHHTVVRWLLLLAMVTTTLTGSHTGAHALDSILTATSEHASLLTIDAASHQCPSCPLDQHDDADGCSTCAHCGCHALLTVQRYHFDHFPLASNLRSVEPFTYLPEVYLSKFIPPQNPA
jgi:hypothetical protein